MKNRNIKNPLTKRIPRELRDDWKKYLVVSLFLVLTIGFVSGMYVANGSMMKAADEGVTKYKLEDGHFELEQEADEALLAAVRTGKQADIRQYYLDQAQKELDETFRDEFDREFAQAVPVDLLGYSVFKNVVVSMYYNSYSLPAYETIWNPEAFFKTTLIPVALMLAVNLAVIVRMMQHTPLQFLRHNLKKTKRKKAIRLPGWKFFSRFRMRIILQNIPNYMILFAGILFIATMLSMAVGMPDTLVYYKEHAKDMMLAKYQYMLKSFEDDTDNPDAEKFALYSLEKKSDVLDEEISVYGIESGSSYVKIDGFDRLAQKEVFVSRSFAEKYDLKTGSSIVLDEKYENSSYRFEIAGIYEQCQSLAVFLPIQHYWAVFDQEEGTYSGYLSNVKLVDLAEDNIATIITERDITKMCDQLDHSMGSYMQYFQVLCVLLSAVLIYLLTKLIIEKNENAISMTKILGYENREIAGLYLLSTTIILVIADVLCVGLGSLVMNTAWKAIMAEYNGWFTFMTTPLGYVKMFVFIFAGYLLVMVLDFRRIRRIPMDEALKGAE